MHLIKIILELKKNPKSNACMKIFDLPKILQDRHFFFIYMYYMYYPASWMSPVHIVHISRATNIQNQSKDMVFFPLGYAMIL